MRLVGSDVSGDVLGLDAGDRQLVRVLRLKRVMEYLGVGRSTIYDWMNTKSPRFDPSFPRPIKLSGGGSGGGAIAWREPEICRWLDSRVVAGRVDPATVKEVSQ